MAATPNKYMLCYVIIEVVVIATTRVVVAVVI